MPQMSPLLRCSDIERSPDLPCPSQDSKMPCSGTTRPPVYAVIRSNTPWASSRPELGSKEGDSSLNNSDEHLWPPAKLPMADVR